MSNLIRRLRTVRPLRWAGWFSLLFFPFYCCLVLEYYNAGRLDALRTFWQLHTLPALFGLLVCCVVFLLTLLLFGRAALACGVMGGVSILLAFINYMKLALNGDHFFPKDVLMAGEASSLLSFLSGGLPKYMFQAVLLLVIWCVGLAVLGLRLPIRRTNRLFFAASAISLCAVFCSGQARTTSLLERFTIQTEFTMLQSLNYEENGFIGAFALNLNSMTLQQPRGYSKEYVDQLLAGYKGTETTGEKFDVILVLSESFCDLREIPGLTFSQNPLPRYDELLSRDNCYSGSTYTNAIGGGTVRPEFEILTGLSTEALPSGATPYEYVDHALEGYVSNYKDAGYRTIAMHPYDPNFYARINAYPWLGFDAFYGWDELDQMGELTYKRGYTTDQSLEVLMEQVLDQSEQPTFLFTITMQNHQPFNPLPQEEIALTVTSDKLSQENLDAVTTYTQGLFDADQMLGALADYVDGRERPTLLIFFGDHKPTLGVNWSAYDESGFFSATDNYNFQDRKKMYSTPFLIYSNRELDPGLFSQNTGNELSSYYLLDAAALCTGFQLTPYMELLLDCYAVSPMYNERLAMDMTPELQQSIQARHCVTYERLRGS
ncbi:LTA synthase family protein [Flintibacter muris]|uniref:LTA synthase family protein n=1 Tax=Flintibacter muris TaxID=2941327 RepID=UPI00203D2AED|nr:LTA synthase family protein [Flintibacter muris]